MPRSLALCALLLSACASTSLREVPSDYSTEGLLVPTPSEPAVGPQAAVVPTTVPRAGAPRALPVATPATPLLVQNTETTDETEPEPGPQAGAAASGPAPTDVDVGSPDPLSKSGVNSADWGVAGVVRSADIPYPAESNRVNSFIPMIFYEGKRFFWRGIEGGAHLWTNDDIEVNLIGRWRFFDIPAERQNEIQGDVLEFGAQFRDEIGDGWWELDAITDRFGNWSVIARGGATWISDRWVFEPALDVRYGSSGYVSRYYGLDPFTGIDADGDLVITPRVLARYKIGRDLYIVGAVRYNAFGDEIRGLETIDESGQLVTFLGLGIFQDRGEPNFAGSYAVGEDRGEGRPTDLVPHVRLAWAEATPSNMGELISFDLQDDPFNNELWSIFYGYPLTDELWGGDVDIFLEPGVAFHPSSDVQEETFEVILKLHFYFEFGHSQRWRLSFAEGVSYVDEPTFIERTSQAEDGYETSNLMNYLDFSADINVGDLFNSKKLEALWFGATLHHRSSIFESASQFGRIKGGSNYVGFYLMWDLF